MNRHLVAGVLRFFSRNLKQFKISSHARRFTQGHLIRCKLTISSYPGLANIESLWISNGEHKITAWASSENIRVLRNLQPKSKVFNHIQRTQLYFSWVAYIHFSSFNTINVDGHVCTFGTRGFTRTRVLRGKQQKTGDGLLQKTVTHACHLSGNNCKL